MSAPSAGKAEDRPVSTRVPPAEVLLDAAADYLDLELRPLLEGYHAFQLRVCVNVLRLVARELRLGPAADARARAGLAALLGESAAAEARADPPAPDDALRAEIASGRLPLDSPALLAHLRDGLRDGLAINNPRWVQPGGDTGG